MRFCSPFPLHDSSPRPASTFPTALILCGLLLGAPAFTLAAEEVLIDGVPHIRNSATPRDGTETWQLQELWRAGGEDDEEIFFGVIGGAVIDDDGNLYLLDRQLCQVYVFSAAGEYLRALSREGEGPGELRRPRDLLFMPSGSLGVVLGFPGKIVQLDLEGNPAGAFSPGSDQPTAGGFNGISGAACRDGHLVIAGTNMSPTDDGMRRTSYLASYALDGAEQVRFLEKNSTPDFARREFIEKDQYFVDRGGWALAPDGRVYAATRRDEFAISVYTPDGTLERVIERPYTPRKRTEAEKQEIADGIVMIVNGQRLEIEAEIEDHDPAIGRIHVTDDGLLWVLGSRGNREQPNGIMLTYDVFGPGGAFIKQVAIACPGNGRQDRLFFAGENRLVLVKGFLDAQRAMFGGSGESEGDSEEEEEPAPVEVVCYEVDL